MWNKASKEWEHELEMNEIPKGMRPKKRSGQRAGTLVVCPVIALSQWKSEIEKFTSDGALTVGIYHGPDRAKEMTADKMAKYDVILTTYQVLEQDFRKMVSPNKVSCPNCGGKFKIDKLRVHLKYFCGEGAQRTEAQARQRRTAERHGHGLDGPGNSSRRSTPKTKKGMTKKTFSTTKKKSLSKIESPRKRVKVKSSSSQYDSDSELSVDNIIAEPVHSKRPSRSAAVEASKRVAASKKEWGASVGEQRDDENEESSYDSSTSDESSESDAILSVEERKMPSAHRRIVKKVKQSLNGKASSSSASSSSSSSSSSSDESSSESSSEEENHSSGRKPINGRAAISRKQALARAKAKQHEALAMVKSKKKGRIIPQQKSFNDSDDDQDPMVSESPVDVVSFWSALSLT